MKFDSFLMPDGRYTVRPAHNGSSNTAQMLREMTEDTSLTRADGIAAITYIGDYIARELARGATVHIEGLGTFGVSLTMKREVDEKHLTGNDVDLKRITFRATPSLRNAVSAGMSRIRVERARRNAEQPRHTLDERRAIALSLAAGQPCFTVGEYSRRASVSGSMAHYDLHRFADEGIVSVRRVGHSLLYSAS